MELTSAQIPNKNRNAYSTQTVRKRLPKILWAFQSECLLPKKEWYLALLLSEGYLHAVLE